MSSDEITPQSVPEVGPLQLGAIYRRRDLHERFGGNPMVGIAPSPSEPVVLLFHTKETSQQFYGDEFDKNGVYWYSGKGARGDMPWNPANVAVRDHENDRRDLLFFERAQRKDGLWRFTHVMNCIEHRIERRPDIDGAERNAIMFGLVPIESAGDSEHAALLGSFPQTEAQLREYLKGQDGIVASTTRDRVDTVYKRSTKVVEYALLRSRGYCEACGNAAPFRTKVGCPYLEVHHLYRIADGGPDRFDRVAAVCPNCHRRSHYGVDGPAFNADLAAKILKLEADRELVAGEPSAAPHERDSGVR